MALPANSTSLRMAVSSLPFSPYRKFSDFEIPLFPEQIDRYYAHPNEGLKKHSEHTREVFLRLCDSGLEKIIDGQIAESFNENHLKAKQIIHDLICFHDIGKLNPNFQKEKMNNEIKADWPGDSFHSEIGWHIFQLMYWERVRNEFKNEEDKEHARTLMTVIAGHHTHEWGLIDRDGKSADKIPTKEKLEKAQACARISGWDLPIRNGIIRFWNSNEKPKFKNAFFPLYKTVYSALILSDSLATAENEENKRFFNPRENEITTVDITHWREFFEKGSKASHPLKNNEAEFECALGELKDINALRNRILHETEANLKNGLQTGKRIFYLEAPTGSGKTNCAINLMLKSLEISQERQLGIKRAFFVFPFINLIEQNVDVLRNSIGANEKDIMEVHSLAELKSEEEENFRREYDSRLFLDTKIGVTSTVNFFEAMGSSRKKANYKLCNLSNSIVIIDELQSIDDKYWVFFEYLLESFARMNNCFFIIMSATLPRIDKLNSKAEENKVSKASYCELLPNAEEYQRHKCFSKRATIKLCLEKTTSDEVVKLLEEQLSQRQSPVKALIVVNTVKRSKEVFDLLQRKGKFTTKDGAHDFKIQLLNAELLPHKKRERIQEARKTGDNLILVSTQCIEAGVDADFDFGIRDFAILDSIEQVAGRINREGQKSGYAELFVVSLKSSEKKDAEIIYGKGRRWDAMNTLGEDKKKQALQNRDYAGYYDEILKIINKKGVEKEKHKARSFKGHDEQGWASRLELTELKDFHAINEAYKENWFIPTAIPSMVFSEQELRQLERHDCIEGAEVNGQKVWKAVYRIKKEGSFADRERFSSIISKFTASKTKGSSRNEEGRELMLLENESDYELEKGFVNSDGII